MSVLIGHASIDENGNAARGKAGDQTQKEVCTRNWYLKSWDVVLRPKTAEMAEKMAKACEAACANPHIGYDQNQRNTLHTEALKVGYDLSKITTDCECDCSSLMCVCAIAGGAPVDKLYYYNNMGTTRTIRGYFRDTGMFEVLTDSKYLTSSDYLKRGDVIVNEGSHTMMALQNGPKAGGVQTITPTVENAIGTAIARGNINVRSGPSTGYKAVGIVYKNQQVQVLAITSNNWYKITWPAAENGFAYVSNAGSKYFNYTSAKKVETTTKSTPQKLYRVEVTADVLRVRKGPGTIYGDAGYLRKGKTFDIYEEVVDSRGKTWGLLDNFIDTRDGWISLAYTKKI